MNYIPSSSLYNCYSWNLIFNFNIMYLKFTKPGLIFDILKQEGKYTVIFEDGTTKPIDTTDDNLIDLGYIMTEEIEIQDLDF